MEEQLLFVYNANGGLFSTAADFAHKILSPATYQCTLCALTHNHFTIKRGWKSFIESLPVQTVFLHKDEFEKKYKIQTALPAVFLAKHETIHQFITKQEIENCISLNTLQQLITEKINAHVQHHHSNI